MEKNEIIRVLEDWNFWKKDLATGYERPHYLNRLKGFLTTSHIIVITGARRSGKSFMMRQLAKSLIKEGVEKNRILFVNLEDPRFTGLDAKNLQKIYEVYLEFLNPKQRPYLFLDEVQEAKEWEKWVRTVHELNKAQLIISGSNAKLLSTELATLLTGRHLDLTLFPLSFREYLTFCGINLKDRLDLINQETNIKRLQRECLESGSFPEVVLAKERREILLKLFEDILNRDIIKRFRIRKGEELMSLTRFYLSNISSLTTFSSLEKFLKVSADTIERFSGYLREAYILYFLKRFSFRVKEQEKSPRKVYAIDIGLANTIGFRFSENLGRLAENLVFLELERRRCAKPNLELYYWKDVHHREVDFVVKEDFKPKELI
ncbi:MAG: ATP-binding protein [bacterium]